MTRARDSEKAPGGQVATLIRQQREAARLAQTELAERAQVSRSRIIALEAGASLPTMALCLKLARALAIPPDLMVRAFIKDSVADADPSVLPELGTELTEGRSPWETVAEHHGLIIERGKISGAVNEEGDLRLTRRYSGCVALRPRQRVVFRDRIIGQRAPAFAVKGSPKGLGYSMNVSIEGEWVQHRVEFHRPWSREDGPFEFEFETVLPSAFVLDIDDYNRRRVAEGLAPRRDCHGDYRTFVSYFFETLEVAIVLPRKFQARWLGPTAVWGNAPIDDADYHEADPRTCQGASFQGKGSEASLVLRRPIPGYTFGIRWEPILWETAAGKGDRK